MTVPKPVRAWVADAESTFAAAIDDWFPDGFDWRALAADLPAIAERLGGTWGEGTAPAAKARLEDLGQSAFRGAYVSALALLSGYDAEADPEVALERLTAPIDDDEERARFSALVESLGEMEERMVAGTPSPPGAAYGPALAAAAAVAGAVRELLAAGLEPAGRSVVELGGSEGAIRKALSGVVGVATALAGIRHQAAVESDEARGVPPLSLDHEALASAMSG